MKFPIFLNEITLYDTARLVQLIFQFLVFMVAPKIFQVV